MGICFLLFLFLSKIINSSKTKTQITFFFKINGQFLVQNKKKLSLNFIFTLAYVHTKADRLSVTSS